ncbi:50S ribosomal protein L11 methyltransferase [Algicella marina]|uniref:Ribosomal protein L11 methyltransferase n=1 Tax=Algicella marina TaxID=2683284 RepID=A0A6P1T2P6_9RHOB|nr:50S ribosomal protein L11 methyltransferase [Algicella marina]QHQ37204.1 methyltransferase [Algicella marina]
MTTFTALTTLKARDAAERLGDAMERLEPAPTGVGVFEIEDGSGTWEVGGYFLERPDTAALALLAAVFGAAPFAVSKLDDRDWVAQVRRELSPVEAGRFVVYGSHDAARIPAQKIGLQIEAAMAFGTGHHATTQGCLLSLDALIRQGRVARNTADIGCGTGVLAMAARAAFHREVIAADIDGIAVATARANMVANGFGAGVPCVRAPGFRSGVLRARAPFDLVMANILAGPLKRLAPDMSLHIEPGGFAILSGILNRQAVSVENVYEGHGFAVRRRRRIGEWTTLTLERA